ncbi:MAG: M20/M25/M40 family metallo-hydrolase [Geminicoccaceae bacterium]
MPFRIDGDRAYGPGIYDMKGGAFLAFAAFRELVREGRTTPLPLRWLITSDEEVGSPTSRDPIRAAGAKARHVLVTEPGRDGGKCVTARKGTARYAVHFTGRPAHSGARHADGRSAIREMARHILELEAITDYAAGITTNVGLVRGGTAVNTVSEKARIDLDVRFPSEQAMRRALGAVEARKAHDGDVDIRVEGGLDRPSREERGHRTAVRACTGTCGRDRLHPGGYELGRWIGRQFPCRQAAGARRHRRRWRWCAHLSRAHADLFHRTAHHPDPPPDGNARIASTAVAHAP